MGFFSKLMDKLDTVASSAATQNDVSITGPTKKFDIIQVDDFQDNIISLGSKNPAYNYDLATIVKKKLTEQDIPAYIFKMHECTLVEDNDMYRVDVGTLTIGYLKKGNVGQIRNLFKNDSVRNTYVDFICLDYICVDHLHNNELNTNKWYMHKENKLIRAKLIIELNG